MSFQLLPTIIFFLAVFAAILMVLRRLSEAGAEDKTPSLDAFQPAHHRLFLKGLPAKSFSKIKHHSVFIIKKVWRFILEAKAIVPTGTAVLKIKKLFQAKTMSQPFAFSEETAQVAEEMTESDYLAKIKKEPKNLAHYDELGKFYLTTGNLQDAKDVYLYLTSHASGNADFWAHLGFTAFKLKNFKQAASTYEKSLALDSSQPNRYYNLAQSLKAAGQIKEALEALNKALIMDPQNFKFLELKGRLEKSLARA